MSSKKRKHTASVEDGRDKPDFAADWFGNDERRQRAEARKQGAKDKDKDSDAQATLAQALKGDMADKLKQMKASLEEEAAQKEARAKQGQVKPRAAAGSAAKHRTGQRRHDDGTESDEAESFAELFNPMPADEESFERLLDDSKLDWRSFKE
ncbi:DUF3886 domain-containing protein [Alicyclobacillus ferrooxydans]|uniref:Uncharacterized protein n=1 Tax=Alicyclobacillus ferrooxydans TaxID=471514 RepID=A0A0P9GRJ4_9BACL|nr:hypothetical protein [Alicyclobacillus ferrooxydans]KPV43606.1 hypothetical protein AN477_11385 [Alicyclobacillus ferrooxydans]